MSISTNLGRDSSKINKDRLNFLNLENKIKNYKLSIRN